MLTRLDPKVWIASCDTTDKIGLRMTTKHVALSNKVIVLTYTN